MHDVIVIGSGPAGSSAAIYTSRGQLDTLIISKNKGAMAKSEKIENYYGFPTPVSAEKLIASGILQAERFGAQVVYDQVISISFEDVFILKTVTNEFKAKSVIIATGSNRTAPKIKGFTNFEGKGISYCALCDGFFYKGKDVAVLGCCEYARHEAMDLLPIAKTVTLITNGAAVLADFPENVKIITTEIAAFEGKDVLQAVRFLDGSTLPVTGIFIAIGVAGSSDLAKQLGAQTEGLKIAVDENMATNIPGLYAAGDCTGGLMQIVKAVYEGAKAGIEVVKFIRNSKSPE